MITLRQLRSVVAVFEEGSFTLAAERENATQSGVSQHVGSVEKTLGVALFTRGSDGVKPTASGQRYYTHAVQVLRQMEQAKLDAREASEGVSGSVRAGLMPMFTRAVLPPVLDRFLADYTQVDAQVIEGYSGALTEMVRAEALDFALVPAGADNTGLTVTHLVRDREMLVSGPSAGLPHGRAVICADLPALNMIVPTTGNVRRAKLDEYIQTHGIRIKRLLEMDAMMGTLRLIEAGNWVSILPGLICVADKDGKLRHVSPLGDPPLYSEFVMIEPARRPLSPQAKLFLEALRSEIATLSQNM